MTNSRTICFEIHYGGQFVNAPVKNYTNGTIGFVNDFDVDHLSFFGLQSTLTSEFGLQKEDPIFFVLPGSTMIDGLIELENDEDIAFMRRRCKGFSCIQLFTEAKDSANIDSGCDSQYVDENNGGSEEDEICTSDGSSEAGEKDQAEQFANESSEEDEIFVRSDNLKRGYFSGSHEQTDKEFTNVDPYKDTEEGASDELLTPPHSSDDEQIKSKVLAFDKSTMQNPRLQQWMTFADVYQFRQALKNLCIGEGRDITFVKNESNRVTAKCKENCGWRIHASKISGERSFKIKRFNPEHTCGRRWDNKQVSTKWLSEKYINKFRIDEKFSVKSFKGDFYENFKLSVSKSKLYRAKKRALNEIHGDHGKQYSRVWDYCEKVRETNVGSITKVKVSPTIPPRFERLFVSFNAQIQGFSNGCRPFISVDGCHIKSHFGGQILTAIAKDGNNNFFPLALAVVEIENRSSWSWFLNTLFDCIGPWEENDWVVMHDRQKGLTQVLEEELHGLKHRYCLRHLCDNFRDAGFKGEEFKDALWEAGRAYTVQEFEMAMKKLEKKSSEACKWLRALKKENWSRHAFDPKCKTDLTVNNLSESFNSYILDARDKPILTMIEHIRIMLMQRIGAKFDGIKHANWDITPSAKNKLENEKLLIGDCVPICAGDRIWQVNCKEKAFVVNLRDETCGCFKWNLTGIPCKHAISAIYDAKERPETYVHRYYKREAYLAAYQNIIYPIPSEEDWPNTKYIKPEPPIVKNQPGRPKKKRRKGAYETQNPPQLRVRRGSTKCSNCKKYGHNVKTCKEARRPDLKIRKNKKQIATQTSISVIAETPSVPSIRSKPYQPRRAAY